MDIVNIISTYIVNIQSMYKCIRAYIKCEKVKKTNRDLIHLAALFLMAYMVIDIILTYIHTNLCLIVSSFTNIDVPAPEPPSQIYQFMLLLICIFVAYYEIIIYVYYHLIKS